MKKNLYFIIIGWLCLLQSINAQEKLLYSTDFQDWAIVPNSASVTEVTKKTDFTSEDLTFKFLRINVNPTGRDETRFNYELVNNGWAMADKHADSYFELSPLASVTKVVFTHGATGSNRGYRLEKKSATTNNQWEVVTSSVANPSSGTVVTAVINDTNVALRFSNLTSSQNAYMFDLKIYGNYTPTGTQYLLTTGLNIPDAGTIVRTPYSDEYIEGSVIKLSATPNFGYKFSKWVDVNNADSELSAQNPYTITMDAAKNIKAVFETVTTYNFTLNKMGSTWGEILVSPEPVNGKYEEGTEVTMQVIPNPVTSFSYWEDNSTALSRTVIINSDVTYTATFDEIPFIVGWNFKDQSIRSNKTADYYAETSNVGVISAYEPDGTTVNWLANAGSFSPSYANIRLWTGGAEFKTRRRYVQAQFSTVGYKNIRVHSKVSANYQAYSVMTFQYSLDGVNFTKIGSADITSVHNSGWADLNIALPEEGEGKSMVYIRWIADATSPIINEGNDNDGAALANVYVYADKEIVNDAEAPILVSVVPQNNSNTATINGSIVLTFNERVQAGTGDITLGPKILTGIYGAKSATFTYEKLTYDTEYTFTVPAGAIKDMSGNVYEGITVKFRTGNKAKPIKKLFDAVVAQDGSGDFTSVIDAINAAPVNRTAPWLIYIKNGKYTGHHDIPSNKPFIHLIGQSRDGVIISDDLLSGGENAVHVSVGATMVVNSTDCYFENLTLENSWGYEQLAGPQALALYSNNDRFTLNNVYLRSYQDTYLTSTKNVSDRHYVKGSRIEGAVDFIYGAGDVFFDRDTISVNRADGGYIVAPSHKENTAYGYVFRDSYLMKDRVSNVVTYFGRPWQGSPKTVFINTKLLAGISVYPKGWHYKMGAIPSVFADYNTVDVNGNLVDVSQRIEDYEYDVKDGNGNVIEVKKGKAKKSLTDQEAAEYSYENVILRAGDTWDPRLMTEAPDKPTNLIVNNNQLTWNEVDYARLYIVFRDNKVIGFSLSGDFIDGSAIEGNNYAYKVQSVGEFGALSLESEVVTTLPVTGISLKAIKANQAIQLSWSTLTEKGTSHFIIERTLDGNVFELIGNRKAVGESNVKQDYYFTDTSPKKGVNLYRIKAVDFNGQFDYSEIVAVKLADEAILTVYPNPVTDNINISLQSQNTVKLNIYDLEGKKQISVDSDGLEAGTSVDVSKLSIGVYILEVIDGNIRRTIRFVKR